MDVGLAETQAKGSVLTPDRTIGLVPVALTGVPAPEEACTFTNSVTFFTCDSDHALASELELANATVLTVNVTPPSTSVTLLVPPVVPGTTVTPDPGWHPSLLQVASGGATSLLLPQLRVASNAKIPQFFITLPRNSLQSLHEPSMEVPGQHQETESNDLRRTKPQYRSAIVISEELEGKS